MNLGGIYQEIGNLDKALTCTLKSLEIKSNQPDGHMIKGIIYQEIGDLNQAKLSMNEAINLQPENASSEIQVVIAELQTGPFNFGIFVAGQTNAGGVGAREE